MMNFSRMYDTESPPTVEDATILCESLAIEAELFWKLLGSPLTKPSVGSSFRVQMQTKRANSNTLKSRLNPCLKPD